MHKCTVQLRTTVSFQKKMIGKIGFLINNTLSISAKIQTNISNYILNLIFRVKTQDRIFAKTRSMPICYVIKSDSFIELSLL